MYFKLVRSKTRLWPILRWGTGLCAGLFGCGDNKTEFKVLDCCQKLVPADKTGVSLLGDKPAEVAATLHEAVASMNPSNFLLWPGRQAARSA
ncbi:hypothetical protein [Candidatus Poriferisodalis sp.]|uniref:hypothetical protein n=1 Tax=Candidatus Poriferisodalis sp. TaxID=3101277 RepID=UPI003B020F71